ncbi:MAG: MFS transporter [Planctomycetes bacterium]|nr:MFS transporter [Planctomycetota bacterium]
MDRRRRLLATVGILTGLFLGALDATVVGTSMPTIIAELGGLEVYFLVFSGFMVCQVVAVPVFGRLSDLYGRRRLHLLGVVLYVAASMACGVSRTMPQLIAFRSLQGVGAGCLMALSFTMIGDLFPLEQRARMQGAISGVWGISSLAGPLLGGFITQHWGWPWVFYVNAPFGVASALMVQGAWKDDPRGADGRPDLPGAALLVAAAGALLGAFTAAGRGVGWRSPLVLGALAASLFFLALLVVVERRTKRPFLQYDLYRSRLFTAGALTGCCAATVLFATTSYLPLFVQGVLGESPTRAGLILVPMMVPWLLASGCSGMLLLRLGYRNMAVTGMALSTGGYVLLARLGPDATWWGTALPLVAVGAGLGLTIAPLLIAAQSSVSKERMGAATSLTQFTRTMGAALGVAVMGAFLAAALAAHGPTVPGAPSANDIVDPLRRRAFSQEQIDLWRLPLAKGMHGIFVIAAVAGAVGLLLALFIPGGRAQDQAVKREPTVAAPGAKS